MLFVLALLLLIGAAKALHRLDTTCFTAPLETATTCKLAALESRMVTSRHFLARIFKKELKMTQLFATGTRQKIGTVEKSVQAEMQLKMNEIQTLMTQTTRTISNLTREIGKWKRENAQRMEQLKRKELSAQSNDFSGIESIKKPHNAKALKLEKQAQSVFVISRFFWPICCLFVSYQLLSFIRSISSQY
uniref:AlNc14C311G10487 protein n=1 Tax=Albugo laibachii Nc14 TaxID=890382 RepID=F0WW39_9STRA|nr:AlNc14C311G10487 [Albugo laibachii Nc14]|eukprot:CCA25647.1 AlNc14C311G10487 [Albugo laibachii Nc14]